MNFYQPLLACSLLPSDVKHSDDTIFDAMTKLRYPVWATLKKDGVRAIRLDGTLKSRTRKVIKNKLVCQRSLILPGGYDVELWNPDFDFHTISGIVRTENSSQEDADKIQFHVLDWFGAGPYISRMFLIEKQLDCAPDYVKFEWPTICRNETELFELFLKFEKEDGEGICFRTPLSPYPQKYPKENRSTLDEQWLIKYSRYIYEEAIIVGFEEQMENTNTSKRNAIGHTKRSHDASGMVPKGTLGAFWVRQDGKPEFKVASGMDDNFRKQVWNNRPAYLGQQLTFKHKPYGKLNKPRSPIYDGMREQGY